MRILCWPQPSMRSYKDSYWLLDKDSQMNKLYDWITHLPAHWEWRVIIPKPSLERPRIHDLNNVTCYPADWGRNALMSRYVWDDSVFRDSAIVFKPDLVLTQIPELARNMRVILDSIVSPISNKRIPIASDVIHIYEGDNTQHDFTMRQLDGIWASDVAGFQLGGTALKFQNCVRGFYKCPLETVSIWNALFDPAEVLAQKTERIDPPAINVISRLSDPERTRPDLIWTVIRSLKAQGVEFQVWVADPNSTDKIPPDIEKDIDRLGYEDREDYLSCLWQSTVVPILWDPSSVHSRGYCEAIESNNHVFSGTWEPVELTRRIRQILEAPDSFDGALDKNRTWLHHDRGVLENIHKVREDFERVVD